MVKSLGKCYIKGTSSTSFRFVSVLVLGFVALGMFSIKYAGSIKFLVLLTLPFNQGGSNISFPHRIAYCFLFGSPVIRFCA